MTHPDKPKGEKPTDRVHRVLLEALVSGEAWQSRVDIQHRSGLTPTQVDHALVRLEGSAARRIEVDRSAGLKHYRYAFMTPETYAQIEELLPGTHAALRELADPTER